MKQIITDASLLAVTAEPLEFLADIGIDRTEGDKIIKEIKEIMSADSSIIALSAPQIGINRRIFCIRFNDVIKTFINPIITKKTGSILTVESCLSLPGKEILISRPEEITTVYYTDEFKYEDNKLLGSAAAIFDQQIQILDGVLPSDLGLVSSIETDGKLSDLTEEEFKEVKEIYQKFIQLKTANAEQAIQENKELSKQYNNLKFAEGVINGRIAVVEDEESAKQRKALNKATKAMHIAEAKTKTKTEFKSGIRTILRKRGHK